MNDFRIECTRGELTESVFQVSVAVVDGYGTNSWSKTVKAEIDSEAAKCKSITSVAYTAGAGDLAATNAAITGAAAKGSNITRGLGSRASARASTAP